MFKNEKKIIFIGTVASSVYGFRADLIHKLQQKNYQVYAFFSEFTNSEIEKIENMGVIPKPYNLNRGGLNPFSDILAVSYLSREIKKINPDIVFCYFSKPVIFGSLAAKLAKVPKVVGMLEGLGLLFTEQKSGFFFKIRLLKLIQTFLYKLTIPLLDSFILLNEDDERDLLLKYNINAKARYILGGIGVELNKYNYQEVNLSKCKKEIRFLFIGRLLKEKGIYDFIEAAKIVRNAYPASIFTVLGSIDNDNLGSLSSLELSKLVNSGVIEYPGQVQDVKAWIYDCHVFVLPSYYREGVPRSTQEAMAIGRAVITTNVPGCKETVVDGVNGFLVERWSPEALAEKMIYFIDHPEDIKRMGNESYKIAKEKFNANNVNEKLISILES